MKDSIQGLRAFSQRMFDLIENYLTDKDNTFIEEDGVFVTDDLNYQSFHLVRI
ncbi:MAG: hypothetical protein GX638_11460 [Crenarchaeota archaeon]|nr:hypothetical protein [Thermoproteota archaeon]